MKEYKNLIIEYFPEERISERTGKVELIHYCIICNRPWQYPLYKGQKIDYYQKYISYDKEMICPQCQEKQN